NYLKALRWCLGHRWIVFVAGFVFLISAGGSAYLSKMSFEFMSAGDQARAAFQVELPPGATLRQTDAVVQQVTRRLQERPEVTSVYAAIGGQDVNQANIYADMTPKGDRTLSQQAFARTMVDELKEIPGIRIRAGIAQQGGGPGDGTSYTFSILGDDPVALNAAARKVEDGMRGVPGLANVVNSAAIARPELLVVPRSDEAALLGVSTGAISQAVRVATIGDVDQNLPKYNLGDRQVPIRLQLTEAAREDLSVLQTLQVPTSAGGSVPLSSVADITFGGGPATVSRQDRSRVASITAELDGIATGAAGQAVQKLPSVQNLPNGVRQ